MSLIPELNHLKIPLEDIKLATENFSDSNFIGQGGFGRVYRGRLPVSTSATSSSSQGTMVAVKRLDVKFGQGQREFLMEIVMLASYKHDNVVSLVGFCDEGNEKIIVYKHEVHGSLDKHLESDLTWAQRINICLGAARGLNYLHSGVGEGHRVLHRDIKSSNVLLDENWKAKISDFGLSKIGPTNQDFTFLVTNGCGTWGYVDPVYVSTGVLTKESDVYSFGVLLFEVLCGRLAVIGKYDDERRFLSHLARLRYEEGKIDDIIFPKIRNQIKHNSSQTFSKIAYQCLNMDRKRRPTMAEIVEQLRISLELQLGLQQFSSPQRDYGESMDNNASGDEVDNYLWSPSMSDRGDSYMKGNKSYTSLRNTELSFEEIDLQDSATSLPNTIFHFTSMTKWSSQWEPEYIKKILTHAKLSLQKGINVNLYSHLETHYKTTDPYSKTQRKAIFDCVYMCTESRRERAFHGSYEGWEKWSKMLKRKDLLADEIWREICRWTNMQVDVVDEMVEKDMSGGDGKWLDFEVEGFGEGVVVENDILSALIDEIVCEFLPL